MTVMKTLAADAIQEVLIEKLASLSLEQKQEVLAFTETLTQPTSSGSTLWEMVQECVKDVPPEAWDIVPTDGALNHDHYLYGAPKRYDETGAPIAYEKLG